MAAKALFRFAHPKYHWQVVSLEGVDDVPKLKEAIKAAMKPAFDNCPRAELTIKATKMEVKNAGRAVVLGGEEDLESILRRFEVEDRRPSIKAAFAKNIRLFVSGAPSGKWGSDFVI